MRKGEGERGRERGNERGRERVREKAVRPRKKAEM